MCTSLEQGYSYYCLQEVCSVFSVFKQFIGNSIYYMATLKMQIIKLVFSIFPRTHGRLAVISTKLEVEKQQNKYLLIRAFLARGQCWSPLVLEISIILQCSREILLQEQMQAFLSFFFFTDFFQLSLCIFLNFIFKLYNIVLVLPNIEMNLPQVYLCSPS